MHVRDKIDFLAFLNQLMESSENKPGNFREFLDLLVQATELSGQDDHGRHVTRKKPFPLNEGMMIIRNIANESLENPKCKIPKDKSDEWVKLLEFIFAESRQLYKEQNNPPAFCPRIVFSVVTDILKGRLIPPNPTTRKKEALHTSSQSS